MSGGYYDDNGYWIGGGEEIYLPYGHSNTTESKSESGCYHDWKLYHGFSEQYYYCTKCDKKKSLEEKANEE